MNRDEDVMVLRASLPTQNPEKKKKQEKRTSKADKKKISVTVSDQLFEDLQQISEREHTKLPELGRLSLKLLTIFANLEPGTIIVARQDGKTDEQILFLI